MDKWDEKEGWSEVRESSGRGEAKEWDEEVEGLMMLWKRGSGKTNHQEKYMKVVRLV